MRKREKKIERARETTGNNRERDGREKWGEKRKGRGNEDKKDCFDSSFIRQLL